MEKKTYVIMVAEKFPRYHPKAGEPTGFEEKILSGEKYQTIRPNYQEWNRKEIEINSGRAVLSIRKWSGKPYAKGTTHIEIKQLDKIKVYQAQFQDFSSLEEIRVATWDGLSYQDFIDWVKGCKDKLDAVITW